MSADVSVDVYSCISPDIRAGLSAVDICRYICRFIARCVGVYIYIYIYICICMCKYEHIYIHGDISAVIMEEMRGITYEIASSAE